jgi:glycosyltransferase involved in cell wall biosynthesis
MEIVLLSAAMLIFSITCISAADLFFGVRGMRKLSNVKPLNGPEQPLVSVILPACNEEEHIEQAIRSQLDQDYRHLEIIAVNDRSTDSTGAILEKLKEKYESLKVIHVDSLPRGWMGKAHALQLGAESADGRYLLFTDGDVSMDHSTLSRAVGYMHGGDLDHISLIFRNVSSGLLLNSLILDSGAGLLQLFRPWRARIKTSKNFIGVGAFNMVKREVYRAVGGHRSPRMHPIDDIMLGKIIKRGGYSQECLLGTDLVTVPWYADIGDMVNGLMKNAMAVINYRYSMLLPLLCVMILLNIVPFWAMIFSDGFTQLLFFAVMAIKMITFYCGTRLLNISPWCAPATIITPYISIFIVLRAAWLTYRNKGIYWRGTHYSLEELRKNEPLLP